MPGLGAGGWKNAVISVVENVRIVVETSDIIWEGVTTVLMVRTRRVVVAFLWLLRVVLVFVLCICGGGGRSTGITVLVGRSISFCCYFLVC